MTLAPLPAVIAAVESKASTLLSLISTLLSRTSGGKAHRLRVIQSIHSASSVVPETQTQVTACSTCHNEIQLWTSVTTLQRNFRSHKKLWSYRCIPVVLELHLRNVLRTHPWIKLNLDPKSGTEWVGTGACHGLYVWVNALVLLLCPRNGLLNRVNCTFNVLCNSRCHRTSTNVCLIVLHSSIKTIIPCLNYYFLFYFFGAFMGHTDVSTRNKTTPKQVQLWAGTNLRFQSVWTETPTEKPMSKTTINPTCLLWRPNSQPVMKGDCWVIQMSDICTCPTNTLPSRVNLWSWLLKPVSFAIR